MRAAWVRRYKPMACVQQAASGLSHIACWQVVAASVAYLAVAGLSSVTLVIAHTYMRVLAQMTSSA